MTFKKTRFFCQECGHQSLSWLGRCPGCGSWNTLVEERVHSKSTGKKSDPLQVFSVSDVYDLEEENFPTGIKELDRVLGGGIVPASVVLLGGDPGIGKSTLLLQVAERVSKSARKVLYASGEESVRQLKLRALRLKINNPDLYLVFETDLNRLKQYITSCSPFLVIIDSIQTVFSDEIGSTPGSVSQIRECTVQLMRLAKDKGVSIFIIGHVTKEGFLAGPRLLEHLVDTVLYLEGERHQTFRILRAYKNRFGSTNEIGVFEIGEDGLVEITNPSEFFIMRYDQTLPGSVVVPTLEGTRPLLVEVQALVSPTLFNAPRRMSAGVDYNRMVLIAAVLEKRAGLYLGNYDAYVNAAGGVRIEEPAVDLGIALALSSSYKDIPVDPQLVVMGEIGLTGEIRPVAGILRRINEAAQLGFKRCLVPADNLSQIHKNRIDIIGVETLARAIEIALQG